MNPRMVGIVVLALALLVAAPARAGAPLGGDDTGCVPSDDMALKCEMMVAKMLAKLDKAVTSCHLKQANQAFKTGHSSLGNDNAEENCEIGPSNTSAKAKFDNKLADLAAICDPALIAAAETRRDAILAGPDSLDALNASFFCDSTSGLTIAEPDGDDSGFIAPGAGVHACELRVAKIYAKLVTAVYKCHYKAAYSAFKGRVFDEDVCEDAAPAPPFFMPKSALARYDAYVQKLVTLGICPPCLVDAVGQPALTLGASAVAALDAQNGEIFSCP